MVKTKTISIAFIILLVIIVGKMVDPPVLLFSVFDELRDRPSKPEITYGEFPLRLEYEINGQRKIIKDTLICEYDGMAYGDNGWHRLWKGHLASGKNDEVFNSENIVLLEIKKPVAHECSDNMVVEQVIVYPIGSPEYFMGEHEKWEEDFPDCVMYEVWKDGSRFGAGRLPADELLNKYHIKLIKWDHAAPIKNKLPPLE